MTLADWLIGTGINLLSAGIGFLVGYLVRKFHNPLKFTFQKIGDNRWELKRLGNFVTNVSFERLGAGAPPPRFFSLPDDQLGPLAATKRDMTKNGRPQFYGDVAEGHPLLLTWTRGSRRKQSLMETKAAGIVNEVRRGDVVAWVDKAVEIAKIARALGTDS